MLPTFTTTIEFWGLSYCYIEPIILDHVYEWLGWFLVLDIIINV